MQDKTASDLEKQGIKVPVDLAKPIVEEMAKNLADIKLPDRSCES
jgi:hypothetical protein